MLFDMGEQKAHAYGKAQPMPSDIAIDNGFGETAEH
jgi:hypothetical protein